MLRALAATALLLLAGCSWPAGDAPPSAREPIELTAAGLTQLFRQECLEQRSAAWARLKYRNWADGCWADDDDCRVRLSRSVSWVVPTAEGQGVKVTLDWQYPLDRTSGPPDNSPLNCSISVKPQDAATLRRVLAGIRTDGTPLVAGGKAWLFFTDWGQSWEPADKSAQGPVVQLLHYFESEQAYRAAVVKANGGLAQDLGPADLAGLSEHTERPWSLRITATRR